MYTCTLYPYRLSNSNFSTVSESIDVFIWEEVLRVLRSLYGGCWLGLYIVLADCGCPVRSLLVSQLLYCVSLDVSLDFARVGSKGMSMQLTRCWICTLLLCHTLSNSIQLYIPLAPLHKHYLILSNYLTLQYPWQCYATEMLTVKYTQQITARKTKCHGVLILHAACMCLQ